MRSWRSCQHRHAKGRGRAKERLDDRRHRVIAAIPQRLQPRDGVIAGTPAVLVRVVERQRRDVLAKPLAEHGSVTAKPRRESLLERGDFSEIADDLLFGGAPVAAANATVIRRDDQRLPGAHPLSPNDRRLVSLPHHCRPGGRGTPPSRLGLLRVVPSALDIELVLLRYAAQPPAHRQEWHRHRFAANRWKRFDNVDRQLLGGVGVARLDRRPEQRFRQVGAPDHLDVGGGGLRSVQPESDIRIGHRDR